VRDGALRPKADRPLVRTGRAIALIETLRRIVANGNSRKREARPSKNSMTRPTDCHTRGWVSLPLAGWLSAWWLSCPGRSEREQGLSHALLRSKKQACTQATKHAYRTYTHRRKRQGKKQASSVAVLYYYAKRNTVERRRLSRAYNSSISARACLFRVACLLACSFLFLGKKYKHNTSAALILRLFRRFLGRQS